jgi:hypothetical protein
MLLGNTTNNDDFLKMNFVCITKDFKYFTYGKIYYYPHPFAWDNSPPYLTLTNDIGRVDYPSLWGYDNERTIVFYFEPAWKWRHKKLERLLK